jgi:hypothetical protein
VATLGIGQRSINQREPTLICGYLVLVEDARKNRGRIKVGYTITLDYSLRMDERGRGQYTSTLLGPILTRPISADLGTVSEVRTEDRVADEMRTKAAVLRLPILQNSEFKITPQKL